MDERLLYEQGIKVLRAVLGDVHVDASLKNRNEFDEAFQDLIMRYAGGEIWTRPGLPRQTRSIITLGIMVALNRPDELRMHLRAALNNGVTREEIQELLLQTDIYCGVLQQTPHFISQRKCLRSKTMNLLIRWSPPWTCPRATTTRCGRKRKTPPCCRTNAAGSTS